MDSITEYRGREEVEADLHALDTRLSNLQSEIERMKKELEEKEILILYFERVKKDIEENLLDLNGEEEDIPSDLSHLSIPKAAFEILRRSQAP